MRIAIVGVLLAAAGAVAHRGGQRARIRMRARDGAVRSRRIGRRSRHPRARHRRPPARGDGGPADPDEGRQRLRRRVAVGATLNMMEPQMNGIGGNGFMTLYDKKSGKVLSLAMAGASPKALKAEAMTPRRSTWASTPASCRATSAAT
jgi:hypothetical protein